MPKPTYPPHLIDRLTEAGLTTDQWRRSTAAHELGHAFVSVAMPTTVTRRVGVFDGPDGPYGLTHSAPAKGRTEPDPMDRAAVVIAGYVAKKLWFQNVERVWNWHVEDLVYVTAAADRAVLDELRLRASQNEDAERAAHTVLREMWPSLAAAVPKLLRAGQLTERQVNSLARAPRPGLLAALFR